MGDPTERAAVLDVLQPVNPKPSQSLPKTKTLNPTPQTLNPKTKP